MKINDFLLERFFAKYEFKIPYLLCASDCESFSIEEILQLEEGAEKKFKNLKLGYTDSQGSPELREMIATLYNNVSKQEILAFAGAEEGIFAFMNIVLNPGDQIIVQFPAYQSLFEIAEAVGCKVTKWTMEADNNWNLDLNFLLNNITAKTKAIVINFPHNPTGSLISQKKYESIIEIAQDNKLYLLSDEVYRMLEYNPSKRLEPACDLYDKAISLGVMSKSFGLAGLRIGWTATKDQILLNKLASFKDYTTICNSIVSEYLATLALTKYQALVERNLSIILSNLELLDQFFNKTPSLDWVRPQAGPIAFPKLIKDFSSEKFCSDCIEKAGVLLLPSSTFLYGDNHFRLGFGRKNMPEALSQLTAYLEDTNGLYSIQA
ncbi:MAG: aminotransferase class I/II-fold pyridoxal phosphate-dependent enzyme [Candidatus Hodarchaeales archaeon]|jgi:aspartate/methionine/tyrosine aminotransferase